MKSDIPQNQSISGVRGQNVYELTSRRQLVTGVGNSLDKVLGQRFVNPTSLYRFRAHNAELNRAATGGGYDFLIPASVTNPAVRVHIYFETKPALSPASIHGTEANGTLPSEQGPAQYQLTRDSSGWQAKIELNESLHGRDLPFIIGHELDEIAIIVRANLKFAAIFAASKASLFKVGSIGTPVTAHDRAAARELCAMWHDLQLPPSGTDKAGIAKRENRLSRMMGAMGLKKSANLLDKFRVLRAEGAPDQLLRRIGIPEACKRYLASAKFRALQVILPSFSSSIVDKKLIVHLMIPLDPGRRRFLGHGIQGGHHDHFLHDFVKKHPQIVIVKEAEKAVSGIVYRKYSQYRFRGSGSKPTSYDSRFPKAGDAAAGTYHSDWVLAKQKGMPHPKSTFSSLEDFLLVVDEAWLRWYAAKSAHVSSGVNDFSHFSTLFGVLLTGFFRHIPPDQFHFLTVYVEASWF
jgi:hypothetical protein